MSPTVSQTRIRSGNIDVTAQNPCTKSRAGSTPLCKIPIHGNLLSLKPKDTLRLYFENVNGLPTNNSGCKSDKVKKLRHLWSKLETDVVSLAETQIKPSLLTHEDSLHYALFRHQPASSIHNNNSKELIGKRQQGGIMMAIRGAVSK